MHHRLHNRKLHIIVFTFLAILGAALVLYGMKWGPWAGTDSVAYLEAARNLANGDGLVQRQASGDKVLLSLHPPFYPMMIASLNILSIDIITSAKVANVTLIVFFILLIALPYGLYLNRPTYAIVLCFLILTCPVFLSIFTGAMSEAPFLVISAASLFLMVFYFKTNRSQYLFLSALFAGLSLITRYAGFPIIVVGSLGLLFFVEGSFLKRLLRSGVFLVIAVSPFLVWSLHLHRYGESTGVYEFRFADFWTRLAPYRIELLDIVWRWMRFDSFLHGLDYDQKQNLILVLTLAICIAIATAVVKNQRGLILNKILEMSSFRLTVLFGAFSFLYVAFTALAYLFSKQLPMIPNERIMSPLLFGIFMAGISIAVFLENLLPFSRSLKIILPVFFLAFAASQIVPGMSYIQDLHVGGSGYTSKEWHSSELIQEVQKLPKGLILISNEADAILLYVNRPAYRIPELVLGKKYDSFVSFGEDTEDEIQQIFRTRGAALVLFDNIYWQFNAMYYSRADDRLDAFTRDLDIFSKAADGEIYLYDGP